MTEIIAKRRNSVLVGFIAGLVFFVGFIIVFLIVMIGALGAETTGDSGSGGLVVAVFAVIFVPVIGIMVWQIVRFKKTPKTPIVYENGKLNIGNWLECSPSEIETVTYQQARGGRRGGYTYRWGKLTVNVRGQKITYDFIEDVVAVHDRLIALMMESKAQK